MGVVGLSVLSAALLTRHLGTIAFGKYTTVISLVTLVSAVTDAGMSNIGAHEYAVRRGADRDVLMRDLLGLRVTLTLIGILLAVAFAVGAGYDTALLAGTVAAGLGTVAIVWQHTLSIPLAAALRLGVISSLELARQVLSVALLVALIVAGAGVLPLLAVALAVNLVLIAPTAVLVRGQISARPSIDRRRWVSLLRAKMSFSLATAVGTRSTSTPPRSSQAWSPAVTRAGCSPSPSASSSWPPVRRDCWSASPCRTLARRARRSCAPGYALQRIFEVMLIAGMAAVLGFAVGARWSSMRSPGGMRRLCARAGTQALALLPPSCSPAGPFAAARWSAIAVC
jgi:hypothetical protein